MAEGVGQPRVLRVRGDGHEVRAVRGTAGGRVCVSGCGGGQAVAGRAVQRVAGGDPRLQIGDIQLFSQQNGMLIQLEIIILPSTDAERLSIFFDQQSRNASYV